MARRQGAFKSSSASENTIRSTDRHLQLEWSGNHLFPISFVFVFIVILALQLRGFIQIFFFFLSNQISSSMWKQGSIKFNQPLESLFFFFIVLVKCILPDNELLLRARHKFCSMVRDYFQTKILFSHHSMRYRDQLSAENIILPNCINQYFRSRVAPHCPAFYFHASRSFRSSERSLLWLGHSMSS